MSTTMRVAARVLVAVLLVVLLLAAATPTRIEVNYYPEREA